MTSEPKVLCVVQARMASTRLPGKVLYPLYGTTVLGYLLGRLKYCHRVTQVVVATTTRPEDKAVAAWGLELADGVAVHEDSDDVLGRFMLAAQTYHPDVVVRVTADCPLVCPEVVDWLVWQLTHQEYGYEYARTGESFPEGLDVEVVTHEVLNSADVVCRDDSYRREHLTAAFEAVAAPQHTYRYELPEPLGKTIRLSLDEPRDYTVVSEVAARVGHPSGLREILRLAHDEPALFAGNLDVERNAWRKEAPSDG